MTTEPIFERILIAVDGSPRSERTVEIAVDLARRYGSHVTVVHIREYERYEGDDVDARGEIRRVSPGETPEQIVEVAKRSNADLIVMGSRGMTEWKSLLLGGVANKVVHHATCPVLLVR